jgi:hypothetical protein
MRVVIAQPRYFPCIEFMIRLIRADVFVILDNVKLNPRDFEHRTLVECNGEKKWLTIPITGNRKINETNVIGNMWRLDHQNKINEYYKSTGNTFVHDDWFENKSDNWLSMIYGHYSNIFNHYKIDTEIKFASKLIDTESKGREQIKELLQKVKANEYITGNNCFKYGVTQDYLECIKLTAIDFRSTNQMLIDNYNIDSQYGMIDSIMKSPIMVEKLLSKRKQK